MSARVLVMGLVGAALAVLAFGSSAFAGDGPTLGEALFGPQIHGQLREFDAPTVARYRADAGRAFIFDRVGGREALLKFDDDPEIWVLTPTAGPRGDIIYKNDMGEPVLRATRLGGLTLFTSARPDGAAAAFMGQALAPRAPTVLGPEALLQLMFQASARASRAAQHLVAFDAPEVTPASEAVFAQAFVIAAEAFVHVSQRRRDGPKVLARVSDVRFASGPAPAALVRGPVVEITVAPQLGIEGRPSSELIADIIAPR